jgi:hypothetical protein
MPILSPLQVGVAARKGGFGTVEVPWVIATSFGESGWDTDAIGKGSSYGDGAHNYYGLMQISSIHADRFSGVFPPSERWKDPVVNMTMACTIYKEQGKTAFSGRPEKSAKAQTVAGQAVLIGQQIASMGIEPAPSLGGIEVDGSGAVKTEVGGVIGDAIDNVWQSALKGAAPALWIGGGSILVILGVLLLAKSEVLGSVGKALS